MKQRIYPKCVDCNDRHTLRKLTYLLIICEEILYKIHYEGIHLFCIDHKTIAKIIKEVHTGVEGIYMSGYMLAKKIIWLGYSYSTINANCNVYVRKCPKC